MPLKDRSTWEFYDMPQEKINIFIVPTPSDVSVRSPSSLNVLNNHGITRIYYLDKDGLGKQNASVLGGVIGGPTEETSTLSQRDLSSEGFSHFRKRLHREMKNIADPTLERIREWNAKPGNSEGAQSSVLAIGVVLPKDVVCDVVDLFVRGVKTDKNSKPVSVNTEEIHFATLESGKFLYRSSIAFNRELTELMK